MSSSVITVTLICKYRWPLTHLKELYILLISFMSTTLITSWEATFGYSYLNLTLDDQL